MKLSDNTFNVTDPEHSTGFLLWQVTTLWQRQLKEMLEANYGISHSHYVVMANTHWLTLHGEEVTQVSLSNHTKIEPMTISQILKTIQARGFITKREHSKDTRAKAILLTDKGKELIKKAVVSVEVIDKSFFSLLGDRCATFNENLLTLIRQ